MNDCGLLLSRGYQCQQWYSSRLLLTKLSHVCVLLKSIECRAPAVPLYCSEVGVLTVVSAQCYRMWPHRNMPLHDLVMTHIQAEHGLDVYTLEACNEWKYSDTSMMSAVVWERCNVSTVAVYCGLYICLCCVLRCGCLSTSTARCCLARRTCRLHMWKAYNCMQCCTHATYTYLYQHCIIIIASLYWPLPTHGASILSLQSLYSFTLVAPCSSLSKF